MPLRHALTTLRVLGVLLAVVGAVAIDGSTDGSAGTTAIVWWAFAIAPVALSLVVPGPLGLAVARAVLPVGVPVAVATLVGGVEPWVGVLFVAAALASVLVLLAAETAEVMVQAAAYGDERRFPLRSPAATLPATVLGWVLWCGVIVGGALATIDGRWLLGLPLVAIGIALGSALVAALYRSTRRWLVLVPAGIVLHDPVVFAETVMVPTRDVQNCRLAPADTQAADTTGPAAGHAVEISVREMITIVLAPPPSSRGATTSAIHARSFLVAPLRPGRALAAIAAAGMPVG